MGRANSSLLNTDTEDLKELLANGKSYTVPPYQRDYSWKQEHWEDLWDDLMVVAGGGGDHYMGALVLEVGDRKQFRIIDGQQRLATLSILILACVDVLYRLAEEGVDTEANRERAGLLESSYLGSKDPASLRMVPKLKLNANDEAFFQLNLSQRIPPAGGVRVLRDSERLMWSCFLFFRERVEGLFLTTKDGFGIADFVNRTVAEQLVFISVRVQDQVSAYTVFETLNARGLELTETDLLKNYLLSLADRLSRSQMETILQQWNRITARVGIAAFPQFLRHHLNSKRKFVRQKQLFKTLRSSVQTMTEVFTLLREMENDAVWFEALNDAAHEFWYDYDGAREHVRVLNLFGVSQYIPLIFAAKDVFLSGRDIVEVLRYCAVISVRFNGVGRRSTHALEEEYNRAAVTLREKGAMATPSALKSLLSPIYIPDSEFEADFSALSLKSVGPSGKRLRYLLAKIEKQLSGNDLSDEAMGATVEHILPQNPAEDQWVSFRGDAHEKNVNRLGNLTLLERSLNSQEAGSGEFEEKKRAYGRSQFRMTNELLDYPDWTGSSIQARQVKLAAVAKTVWTLGL